MKGPSMAMFKDQQICRIKSFFTSKSNLKHDGSKTKTVFLLIVFITKILLIPAAVS